MKRLLRKQSNNKRGSDGNGDASSGHMSNTQTYRSAEFDHDSSMQHHTTGSPPTWTLGDTHAIMQQQQHQITSGNELTPRSWKGPSQPHSRTEPAEIQGVLPSSWHIHDLSLRQSDPLCICMNPASKTTVYADRPIIIRKLRALADSSSQVYYFEVSLSISHLPPTGDIAIGFMSEADNFGKWPGELVNSIGWGSSGLYVNGHGHNVGPTRHFRDGDVIGCGMELGGMNGVFFTMNGNMTLPPSPTTTLAHAADTPWYPVVAFRHGNGHFFRGNFGTDPTSPFYWKGNSQMNILTLQGAAVPRMSSSNTPRGRMSPPQLGVTGQSHSYASSMPMQPSREIVHQGPLSRSMPFDVGQITSSMNSAASNFPLQDPGNQNGSNGQQRHSYFGERNHHKRLEDDDPSDVNVYDHFNLRASIEEGKNPSESNVPPPPGTPGWSPDILRVQSNPTYSRVPAAPTLQDSLSSRSHTMNQGSSRKEQRRKDRSNRITQMGRSLTGSSHHSQQSPVQKPKTLSSSTHLPLRSTPSDITIDLQTTESLFSESSGFSIQQSTAFSTTQQSTAFSTTQQSTGSEIPLARHNARALLDAAKGRVVDTSNVRKLLELCKADQVNIQQKLSNALEEADATTNLEELFAVNDEICSAIDAGNNAMEKDRAQSRKSRKPMDGPTIELLVQNEDIFSLICMLRAPNEKRLAAALALMKFARGNEALRNEIRSSGGMHSFLTLFRTKGVPDSVKAIASMAIAYILPSFVVSSQTSAAVGLKIIECLRYLVVSNPVEVVGFSASRQDMLKAASMGVNVLWINAIQPLLILEASKDFSSQVRPELRPSTSLMMSKSRERSTAGVFDQGQESIQVIELTELAVTLITHLAKISDSPSGDPLDVGYNIVEQVCEVDAARPIAVREGLLATLVEWVRSNQVAKIRPAASALRYLISINDQYLAGWIHSQVVSEGAVRAIVTLLDQTVGHDTRVAVAQMLSALCVAPHTRAAVVEAKCVSYLVAILYEHTSPISEEMVCHAANALLQLAAGALTRTTALIIKDARTDAPSQDQNHIVISEILDGWAHGSFVQIALDHSGKLRSVAVEALRVLSEDTNQYRQTRLQLCGVGAAQALGRTLKDCNPEIRPLMKPEAIDTDAVFDPESPLLRSVKDVHESLRGLANIFEQQEKPSSRQEKRISTVEPATAREVIRAASVDMVRSGGLECIIWISALPCSKTALSVNPRFWSADRMNLLEEACRLLANLSPLLLTDIAASKGCTLWASSVYDALHGLLIRWVCQHREDDIPFMVDMINDLLRGLGALAFYEPLKIRIVDNSLPALLSLMSTSGEKNDLSNAASQVLLSLGFTEDEITIQVAGNNPKLLVDWFCLQRALLIQAMARAEVRSKLMQIWQLPFSDLDAETSVELIRQASTRSNMSSSSNGDDRTDRSEDHVVMRGLFENFTRDRESFQAREVLVDQYHNLYKAAGTKPMPADSGSDVKLIDRIDHPLGEGNLLRSQVFPLNDTTIEKEWILSHHGALRSGEFGKSEQRPSEDIPKRIEKLLDGCFPSRILRNDVVPFQDLRVQSSFNFRALMMPQRRYFSFRREGQLLTRLCEKQAGLSDTVDIHWSLAFTNSTFAGEFVESLVQTLYLCPMITGLSFLRNADWMKMRDVEGDNEGEDGGLLANLAGSLPAWVSYLTFDNVLQDRDLKALVVIIDTMGKLSSGDEGSLSDETTGSSVSVRQNQGKFTFIGVRNSPHITKDSWNSFISMLGISGVQKRVIKSMPLSSLTILDLSGNKLGDEIVALILELVHDKDSGCNLEQLDLSGNIIGRGTNMVRVLRAYTEHYRYNQKLGVKMIKSTWKSSLHTLILADNDLFLGQAALEILALLKHNALFLRFLDLSNNRLEGDIYQLLASSVLKNTSLCHLDLSGNKFSTHLIDRITEQLNGEDADCSLSFLLLENNNPPLSPQQRVGIGKFLRRSRKNAILRQVTMKENGNTEELTQLESQTEEPGGLAFIAESSAFHDSGDLRRQSLTASSLIPSPPGDDGENMITVLFSAPLVFADEANNLHPFAKLDFDLERELLWQCMKEASRDIELTFDNAHHSRLLATLTKRCSCLHYSGHGHPNFLPFEDGMGGPNWLNVQDIKELIVRDGAAPFKFVFVSACHSGLAGETFASAGVPHVVCCQQEQELKDTAALAFTRSFYLALAVGHTVKESFEQGCKAVRATPNLKDPEKEMEKFVLLPKDGNHDMPVFRAKPVREWPKQSKSSGQDVSKPKRQNSLMRMRSMTSLGARSCELSTRNMMQDDPAPTAPQFFLGREVDMYYVLTALLKMKKRLVNIIGEPGIGRSSLVSALCHYINERASTITEIQRIYFIKPKHGGRNISCRSLLRQLLEKLQEAGKCRLSDDDMEVEGMIDTASRSLKNEKALIVFDRTELLEKSDDAQELPMILSTLLYETKQVKVILTGKHSLGHPSIGGQVEHPYRLGPLNLANSIRLFGNLCPHLHTPSERGLFCTELIHRCGDSAHLFPGDKALSDNGQSILSTIGDGFPSKIEKAAYSISKEDLDNLRQAKKKET